MRGKITVSIWHLPPVDKPIAQETHDLDMSKEAGRPQAIQNRVLAKYKKKYRDAAIRDVSGVDEDGNRYTHVFSPWRLG